MMRALLCSVFLALGGCVSVPPMAVNKIDIGGQVRAPSPVTRPAYVSVRLYVLSAGQPRLIAQTRYRVTALPLRFAFRLAPEQVAGDGLLLRSELTWSDEGPVQARTWQPAVPGNDMDVRLGPLPCYPKCAVSVVPERL
ncbi:YscW family type III secretion system pilotin [Pseudomonas sp. NPDC089530]|uniref:YscW family type III secretion system pilotin n=1 Tax=Pseudomonas sp. NPDC089530 TaxID=3390651 RepID=UPI003D00DDCA